VLVALVAAACGGSSSSQGSGALAAGQIAGSQIPAGGGGGAGKSSGSTVPLAKQDPTTALFTAIGTFQSCLTGMGVTFIGAPNPSDPSAATNDPAYVKSLTTCAAQSNILQALKAARTAQDNLTPAQIKTENKAYLLWRTCMIGRGWGIPQPKPNANGLLFSFGGTGSSVPNFTPPPGKTILSSSDVTDCASKAESGQS
jgi:hypothetical protein